MKLKRFAVFMLVIVMVALLLTGCNSGGDGNGNGNGNGSDYNSDNSVKVPDATDIDMQMPETSLPDVDESKLAGNADVSSSDGLVTLAKTSASFTGDNISITSSAVYGIVVEITASGTYAVQGTLNQGIIAVAKTELNVKLILNGVNIYCSNYSPIVCTKKSDVQIELAEGSSNYLTDGKTYNFSYDTGHEPNACLYIRKDMTISGSGALTVNANNNNGIGTKAHLTIESGNIYSNAVNNALKGNDSINISGGEFQLISIEDGIKSDNIEEVGLGYINITGGSFQIVTGNDAIQSSTSLTISNADVTAKTGGGSSTSATADSAKGLKAATTLTVVSGTYNLNCNDDGIHSDDTVVIQDGTINISSGDDGIHADTSLTVSGGIINISKSYEGLESQNVTISGGTIKVVASDDGINISGGADNSANNTRPNGRPGMGGGQTAIDGSLTITGGYCYVNSSGDGLDSNGKIVMSGGLVIVHGPTNQQDAPIDYDGSFTMSGGAIIALGSSGMAQQPSSTSTQYSVKVTFPSNITAGTLINLKNSSGTDIVTIACIKTVRSIVVCSPELAKGSYTLSTGGNYSAAANAHALFEGGVYSGGTVAKTFTISNTITTVS